MEIRVCVKRAVISYNLGRNYSPSCISVAYSDINIDYPGHPDNPHGLNVLWRLFTSLVIFFHERILSFHGSSRNFIVSQFITLNIEVLCGGCLKISICLEVLQNWLKNLILNKTLVHHELLRCVAYLVDNAETDQFNPMLRPNYFHSEMHHFGRTKSCFFIFHLNL